ncbi:hypothetical protein H6P81_018113 [Aristolochia fimbriata]|uniref:HAT C-terminal dimerisation domain-containing protein n=1 Tax=Aristolochia fimbriata TaxID=158543 RepID=A0AAV7E1A3_ARIFI|nr:hypothetical protein H6P81_018113 [Aristolochia fimbriata]
MSSPSSSSTVANAYRSEVRINDQVSQDNPTETTQPSDNQQQGTRNEVENPQQGTQNEVENSQQGTQNEVENPQQGIQNEERTQGLKRKKTSPVWSEFKEISILDGTKKVQCLHLDSNVDRSLVGPLWNFGGEYDQANMRRAIAHWILMHEHPFMVVEEEGFNFFLKIANMNYAKISRKTIKRECMEVYEFEKKKLKTLLKDISKISLTTDLWKSQNQKIEYMVITGHFIDDNWKLQKRVLSFVHVPPPRRGIDIADAIHKCLKEWEIENKIFTISVDNAAYSDVCVRVLKENFLRNRRLLCGGKLFHVRCCAHILNLLVQDGLSEIKSIIENVRESVKFINQKEGRLRTFSEIVQQLQLGEKRLIVDCPTRWNSTYEMLSCALKFKDVFPRFQNRELAYDYLPSVDEWKKVEKICEILEVFNVVTKIISGSNYPTSNLYVSEVYTVKEVLNRNIDSHNVFVRVMMLLQVSGSHSSSSSGWSKLMNYVRQVEVFSSTRSELENYLEDAVYICETSQYDFDVLEWWKINNLKYRVLSKMAADILAIPISTVASESTFSAGGRVIDSYRSSLAPNTVQALICGGDWVAMHIVEAVLQDTAGLNYIFYRMDERLLLDLLKTLKNLVILLAVDPDLSPWLLFHIIRCFVLFCIDPRGFELLLEFLPGALSNGSLTKVMEVKESLLNSSLTDVSR